MSKKHSVLTDNHARFQKIILPKANIRSFYFLFALYICKIILLCLILHRQNNITNETEKLKI